jgi:hypothetical protein
MVKIWYITSYIGRLNKKMVVTMTTEITDEDIRRYHAWLESIEFVDEDGNVVDLSGLEPHDDDDSEDLTAEEEADALRLMGDDMA